VENEWTAASAKLGAVVGLDVAQVLEGFREGSEGGDDIRATEMRF